MMMMMTIFVVVMFFIQHLHMLFEFCFLEAILRCRECFINSEVNIFINLSALTYSSILHDYKEDQLLMTILGKAFLPRS